MVTTNHIELPSKHRISITIPDELYRDTIDEVSRRKKAHLSNASVSGVIGDAVCEFLSKESHR